MLHAFSLHLHADYPSNTYTELRTLQAYQCAQLIKKMTRPGDAIILCGDFNHSDSEIGIRAIKSITGVIDSWRSAANKPPGLCHTINTDDNPYGHVNEVTKRIDFIFHSTALKCVDNGLDFQEIAGSKHHYSDHKGVSALFVIEGNTDALETTKMNESQSDEKILCELYDSIARGFKLAEEYKWKWIVPVWVLLLTFILMPVFSEGGIYVQLPLFSQFSGEMVFVVQLICIILSVSYFWNLVILKRIEKHAYLNAMNEIKLKLVAKSTI